MTELIHHYGHAIALLTLASVVTGFAAGLFGIGGGAIIVPVLYTLFSSMGYTESAMHVALATSLATIIVTSARSVQAHHGKQAVDWSVLKQWSPWIIIGALLGQFIANSITGNVLTIVFALLALLLAAQLFFGQPSWSLAPQLPSGLPRVGIGTSIGSLSVLMGIGGGTFGVSLMTLCNRPIKQAIGTASGFGMAIGLPSALAALFMGHDKALPPFSIGYVNVLAFALISSLTVIIAPWGAKAAHAMDAQWLRKLFALLLALVALQMVWVTV